MIGDPKKPHKKKKRRAIPKAIVLEVFERDNYTCQNPKCNKQYPPERGHGLQCHHVIKTSQCGKKERRISYRP